MRYSYEFKRKAIELFYQGEWPKTPKAYRTKSVCKNPYNTSKYLVL